MDLTVLIQMIVVSACVFACEAEIRCYICSTQTGMYKDRCGDRFTLTSAETSKCSGSCQKTRGYRDEGGKRVVEVTRSCVGLSGSDSCNDGTHLGIDATVCSCNEDMCNTAELVTPSKLIPVLSGLIAFTYSAHLL